MKKDQRTKSQKRASKPVKPDASKGPTPLAIIGMGCLFPKADSLQAYWANIRNGVDAITAVPSTHWSPEDYYNADPKTPDMTYAATGGFLSPVDFNPMEFGIAPNAIEATDTTQLLGMMVAKNALADAGYGGNERDFDHDRVSCILGVTGTLELVIPLASRLGYPAWRRALKDAGVGETVAEDVIDRISDSYVPWQEASFPGLLGNVVAGRIANFLDLGGTNCTVDAACAGALSAIHMASMELTAGKSDMVITGGMDTFNDIFMYMCFSKTPALSPTGHARPFDHKADGTILGEGLGAVVLKRLDDARRDGDRVYAVLRSMGSSSDGKGLAIYAPKSEGQSKALQRAYAQVGVTPETIELIEAHGTGTKAGDVAEIKSLTDVYKKTPDQASWCALGAVKSQIGHTKAAAGVAALIKTALALYNKVLPPTIKVEKPTDALEPGKTPFYVNTEARPWLPRPDHPRRAAVSAFGFGGSNFHCLLEESEPEAASVDWDANVQILAFSAKNREALAKELSAFTLPEKWEDLRHAAAALRASFNTGDNCRFALVAERTANKIEKLIADGLKKLKANPESNSWNLPGGAWFASGPAQGKLAFLFPGQGGTYTGMLRDLACRFPELRTELAEANEVFAEGNEAKNAPRLSDRIYPHPTFDKDSEEADQKALRATEVAQPALGALSIGALRILERFGIKAEALAGHSYGELAALCASGRFDSRALHAMSRLRGRLMVEGKGDKGGMLAVRTDLATIEKIVAEDKIDLVIANKNAPKQAILSGATSEIQRAGDLFAKHGVQTTPLAVPAAFHSSLISKAREPFLKALKDVKFDKGNLPVFSNTTAEEYPSAAGKTRELLASQLAKPVEFVHEIENMVEAGVRTFLEVGPGATLTGLAKTILADRDDCTVLGLDASRGKRSGITDLARALAQLAASGHALDLTQWDGDLKPLPEETGSKKPILTIPLSGANYRKPKDPKPPVKPTPQPQIAPPVVAAPQALGLPPAAHAAPAAAGIDSNALAQALRASQENMAALQQIQEQTAQLHHQYLAGQDAAQHSLQSLILQQQQLVQASLGMPMAPMAPAPVYAAPPVAAAPTLAPPPPPQAYAPPVAPPTPAPAATPPASQAPPAPAPAPTATNEEVETILLQVVSEKTGYPPEMLEMDMGLDSDLGIDSIKRVEILSAIQEQLPEAPVIKPQHLGSLQTLREVADFLGAGSPAAAAPTPPPLAASGPSSDKVEQILLQVISEKTGYPTEMLEMDMGLDSDLGIDSIKRVEILSAIQEQLPEAPVIGPDQLGALQTLRQTADFLSAPGTATAEPPQPTQLPLDSPSASSSQVEEILFAIISEKTGYPPEMLEMDMGLDADLGIDSIKRVEILSAVQEQMPEAPVIGPEHLGSLQTLGQIVEFLSSGSGDAPTTPTTLVAAEPAPSEPVPAPASSPHTGIERSILTATHLDEDLERKTVSIPPKSEIWILNDKSDLAWNLRERLCALDHRPKLIAFRDLKKMTAPETLGGLILLAPLGPLDDFFLEEAFRLIQFAGPGLKASAAEGGAILATISRLDGRFGLARMNGLSNPLTGGLAGLSKTVRHEWPEVTCKALDLDGKLESPEVTAKTLIEEIFLEGPIEVGISLSGRWSLDLLAAPLAPDAGEAPFKPGDLVLVTGGARGVTAEVSLALAKAFQPTLVLLGRSKEPEPEPEWLASLTHETEIKRALLSRAEGKASPKEIGEQYARAMSNREILRNLQRIREAGATEVVYRSLNVRYEGAVATMVAEMREKYGPVKGLIHGAGVLADRLIEEKTNEQFEMVYDTKVGGLKAFLAALEPEELRVLLLFSSSTGRFGRKGQIDYAVANEVLNKIAHQQAHQRPGCRVVSVNWGPWAGGMVTPGLEKIFEQEGVALIGLEAGAEYLVREISLAPNQSNADKPQPVEVVVLGAGSDTPEGATAKSAKPDLKTIASKNAPAASAQSSAPWTDTLPLAFEHQVSLESCPFLGSHVMGGKAVLPAAIIMEWLAHGALHANPGFQFQGLEDFRILKGVILDGQEDLRIQVRAGKAKKSEDGGFAARVELVGLGQEHPVPHAHAEIRLGNIPEKGNPEIVDIDLEPWPQGEKVYGTGHLFHGKELQGIEEMVEIGEGGAIAKVKLAPKPSKWFREPLRGSWLADPMVMDCAFQAMILWAWKNRETPCLPVHIARYRQFQHAFPQSGALLVVQVTSRGEFKALANIEILDPDTNALIARIEGYECVIDPSLKDAFQDNELQ